jgi:LPXTG-motif cell wall-anchored protein
MTALPITFLAALLTAQQMPQTTKEKIRGASTVKTEQLRGTVLHVEGNTLVVRMSNGDMRNFSVPESRRFLVDGRELTVHDLKPGTTLQATVTSTTTSVTERTRTIGTGTVFFVSGQNVILTLPNGENRMYKVNDSYRFNIGGEKASVYELRKGMRISAEKIVEEPTTEFASTVAVTGNAPLPPRPQAAPVAARPTRAPVAAEPAPAPEPEPERTPAPVLAQAAPEPPARLPATGSPFPAFGFSGLALIGASLWLRVLRQRR